MFASVTRKLLGADGMEYGMAPKRKAAAADGETAATAKKYKSAMDEMADEWICPITTELPLDPVTAEDGHTYDRSAIKELIRTQGASLKSPITNLAMGSRLFPSTQARNTIEKLVRSGAIGGDKAERWLERLSDEELIKKTVQKAEGGNVFAMHNLSLWHLTGKHGLRHGGPPLPSDMVASFRWAKKGADLLDPACMAQAGTYIMLGLGTEEQVADGAATLVEAAMCGSRYAANNIGTFYEKGLAGFPKCAKKAKLWYGRVANCTVDDLGEDMVNEAAAKAQSIDGA